ncbi:hypothetical protein [Streptomyces sp. NPDC002845]
MLSSVSTSSPDAGSAWDAPGTERLLAAAAHLADTLPAARRTWGTVRGWNRGDRE